ncbi:MAG TPA: hypothetical protein DEF02_01005 [Clostridiales bacterium]|nr:hypothetical protein [Clostridiales bacterium]
MKDVNIILGERIRARRNMLNMTRESLAEKINVSPRFLADVESGKVGVSIETLKNLSVALSASCDYLLGVDEKNESVSELVKNELAKLPPKYGIAVLSLINELSKLD